mgnify:CR=1 FL=1|jgi:hypothetical protein
MRVSPHPAYASRRCHLRRCTPPSLIRPHPHRIRARCAGDDGPASHTQRVCDVCGTTHTSRNALFAHLRQGCSDQSTPKSKAERSLLLFGYVSDAYPAGLQACGVPGSVEEQLWKVAPSPRKVYRGWVTDTVGFALVGEPPVRMGVDDTQYSFACNVLTAAAVGALTFRP